MSTAANATLTRPIAFDRPLTARERQIIEDITRREFIIGGTALTALIAAGCGDDGVGGSAARGGATRTIETNRGPVEVPVEPKRIVAFDRAALDAALALGITPIAMSQPPEETSYLDDLVDGIEVIATPDGWNLERIAALEPDLILAVDDTWYDEVYAELAQIAPTAFVGTFTTAGEWRTYYEEIAAVLTEDEARIEQIKDDYAAKVEEARAALGDLSAVVAQTFNPYAGEAYLYLRDSFIGQVLADVGFAASTSESTEGFVDTLSYEQIELVDADVVFVLVGGAEADRDRFDELTQSQLWQQLPAAQSDRVIEVPFYWLVNGYLSAMSILDDLIAWADQLNG
jgi:iron complex transport system substrate-binding protein